MAGFEIIDAIKRKDLAFIKKMIPSQVKLYAELYHDVNGENGGYMEGYDYIEMNCLLWSIYYDAVNILEYFHKDCNADLVRSYKMFNFGETEASPFLFAVIWEQISTLRYIVNCGIYNLNEKIRSVYYYDGFNAIEKATIRGNNLEIIELIQRLVTTRSHSTLFGLCIDLIAMNISKFNKLEGIPLELKDKIRQHKKYRDLFSIFNRKN